MFPAVCPFFVFLNVNESYHKKVETQISVGRHARQILIIYVDNTCLPVKVATLDLETYVMFDLKDVNISNQVSKTTILKC
jgi:hypothetical protein